MKLVGRYLSPFVRRVATTLNLYGLAFEHVPLQHTGDDAPRLRELNPVGRVPALILDDDQVLVDSAVITDYLDREVGEARALTPLSGPARSRVMSMTALATGCLEKAVATAYEIRFRPEEKRHAPWVDRCSEQVVSGFAHINSSFDSEWIVGDTMTQADVTVAVGWQFMQLATPKLKASIDAPNIDALVERLADTPAFKDTYPA
jgi:glutathione S-transferase